MATTPFIHLPEFKNACWSGWTDIGEALWNHAQEIETPRIVIVVECYPGTYAGIDMASLKTALMPNVTCRSEDLYYDERELRKYLGRDFTRQPFPAPNRPTDISAYFDPRKLQQIRQTIESVKDGIILIHGVGACTICPADILIYSDMSRWELIQRMRRQELSNLGMDNAHDTFTLRYTWSYFLDWPMADRIKRELLPEFDYFLETNNWQRPVLVEGQALRTGLTQATRNPMYVAPFFDPELWNDPGQLPGMVYLSPQEEVDTERDNLLFIIGNHPVEVPAINAMLFDPESIVGKDFKDYPYERIQFRIQRHDRLLNAWHEWCYYPTARQLADQFNMPTPVPHEDHYLVLQTAERASLPAGFSAHTTSREMAGFLSQIPSDKRAVPAIMDILYPEPFDHYVIPSGILHSTGIGTDLLQVSTGPEIWRQWLRKKEKTGMEIAWPNREKLFEVHAEGQVRGFVVHDHFAASGLIVARMHQLNPASQVELKSGQFRALYVSKGHGYLSSQPTKKEWLLEEGLLLLLPSAFAGTFSTLPQEGAIILIIRPKWPPDQPDNA